MGSRSDKNSKAKQLIEKQTHGPAVIPCDSVKVRAEPCIPSSSRKYLFAYLHYMMYLHSLQIVSFVRHGQAHHNVAGDINPGRYLSWDFFDAKLTSLGWQQVRNQVPTREETHINRKVFEFHVQIVVQLSRQRHWVNPLGPIRPMSAQNSLSYRLSQERYRLLEGCLGGIVGTAIQMELHSCSLRLDLNIQSGQSFVGVMA